MANLQPQAKPSRAKALCLIRRLCAVALGAIILGGIFAWLQHRLEDGVFAFLMTLMVPITFAPWLSPSVDRQRR